MVRSHSQITTGAVTRLNPRLGAGGISMGFGMLGASFLLVAPIALWARFGDRAPLRSGAVALAAGLLCWALVRRVAARPASAGAPAALPLPETPPAPRRARPRSRRAPRDVGCPASARRPTRRRTRP